MFYACLRYGDFMAILDYQRKNLKKFTRSGAYRRDCEELSIPIVNFNKALTTKDEQVFFDVYDKFVDRGWISDNSRKSKFPSGIDDELEGSIIPKPNALQTQSKPNPMPSVLPSTARRAKPAPLHTPQVIDTPPVESKKPKVRYNLLIDEDLLERLKAESLEVDRSVSSLIRISIISYLDKKRPLK
jgi:hypothetical protein